MIFRMRQTPKNDFPKNILRRKPFYTETNRALMCMENI